MKKPCSRLPTSNIGAVSNLSRLFIALQPQPRLVADLVAVQQSLATAGKPVAANHLHLTLAFLGNIPHEQELSLTEHLTLIQHPVFDFTLDTLGYFRRPKVLWLGPSTMSAPLHQLHEKVVEAVLASGIALPPTSFRPHVTLQRKAPHAALDATTVSLPWHTDQFCLMCSTLTERGPHYEKRVAFPLVPNH